MDPRSSAQEAVYCGLCETALVQMYCDTCLIKMCTVCVGKHLIMDKSRGHQVGIFQSRRSDQHLNKCPSHFDKSCDQFCKLCQFPVCSLCIDSGCHLNHNVEDIQKILEFRKKKAARDQRLLNSLILPSYQTMAQKLQNELDHVEKEYEEVDKAIVRHGELKHSEINSTVNKLKGKVDTMRNQQVRKLQQQIIAINGKISSIGEEIDNSKNVLDSQSLIVASSYVSKCPEFKMLPQRVNVKVPNFKCSMIPQKEQEAMFGILSVDNVKTEIVYKLMPAALYSSPLKGLMEEPDMVSTINSCHSACLYSVACLGKNMVFTTGDNYTIEGIQLTEKGGYCKKHSRTQSGNKPWDIALNKKGQLVYTDRDRQTMNLLKNEETQVLITFRDWRPLNVCSTLYGDLLVIMDSCDQKRTRVVRYSGTAKKQIIQFDEKGQLLFHSYKGYKYIAENRNLDICVVDCQAGAVVVVDQDGKLRFRYTGQMTDPKNKLFCPLGLTTDSQCQILISDISNDCIDVIDEDGKFLCYIDCGLKCPWGLCTDTDDNLYVAEKGGTLRKIKYLSN